MDSHLHQDLNRDTEVEAGHVTFLLLSVDDITSNNKLISGKNRV